ncbi:MAG: hypothetical protein JSV42_16715 [Chloroflexota bacterium]|nr:MAG: hypothetical protein JSV42_16715 [Chloroflexota bacterium]
MVRARTLFFIISFILLSSCQGAEQMIFTITTTPETILEPSFTPSLTPTTTPTSTATPEPTPEPEPLNGPIATAIIPLRLGKLENKDDAGFSFRAPIGYSSSYQPGQVTLTSDDGDTVVSLIGFRTERSDTLESDLQRFAEIISNTLLEFTTGSTYQYMVGGLPGVAAEVSGVYGESPIAGRILVVAPNETQLFYALAISPDIDTGFGWEPQGRQAFEMMLETVSFYEITIPVE